jgi:hypothetical protein
MHKKVILLILVLMSHQLLAARIPKNWLGKNEISRTFSKEDNLSLEKSYQNLLQTQEDVFSKAVLNDNRNWYLQSIFTEIAVEAEGEFGILAGGGEAALEFVWIRKAGQSVLNTKINSKDPIEDDGEIPSLEIRSEMNEESIQREIEPIAQIALASGFIKNKNKLLRNLINQAKEFQTVIRDIENSPVLGPWYAYKYQLELYVSAEGEISLINLGASVRLRMEWWRLQKIKSQNIVSPYRPMELSPNATFVSHLAEDLKVLNQVNLENDFKLNFMKIGIGKTVKGNLIIAKGKSKIVGSLFFRRDEVKPEHFTEPKLDFDEQPYALVENDEIVQIKRPAMKQALIKSSEILKFFTNKAKSKKDSLFELNVIEGEFELFTTGNVGLVTIGGSVGVTLFATRNVII